MRIAKRSVLGTGEAIVKRARAKAGSFLERLQGSSLWLRMSTQRRKPAVVVLSHMLDNTGAPHVAVDMAVEFRAAGHHVEFYTYPPTSVSSESLRRAAGSPKHFCACQRPSEAEAL